MPRHVAEHLEILQQLGLLIRQDVPTVRPTLPRWVERSTNRLQTESPRMPRLSVIIPTYQRCALLERALVALGRQTIPPGDFEVIVSIDGSADGTTDLVAAFRAPYELRAMWQPHRGRASAVNSGVAAARGWLLVMLDDDMEPAPGFLDAHARMHAGGQRLAVMGAAPIAVTPTSSSVVRYVGSKFNRHLEKLASPDYRFHLADFYSGNLSIRRDVLLEVGLCDEDFRIYGNEDLELAYRLRNAGVRFVYSAEALAQQHYTKDFAALAHDTFAAGKTAVLLVRKHPAALPELRLAAYQHQTRKRRLVMSVLLALGRLWPGMSGGLVRLMPRLGTHRSWTLQRLYPLVMDYFYWHGARMAQREDGAHSRRPRTATACCGGLTP